jgi:hypothetical protein
MEGPNDQILTVNRKPGATVLERPRELSRFERHCQAALEHDERGGDGFRSGCAHVARLPSPADGGPETDRSSGIVGL